MGQGLWNLFKENITPTIIVGSLILGVVGAWVKIDYLYTVLNPDSRMEWKVRAAVQSTKSQIRWCVMELEQPTQNAVLKCIRLTK